ncbi:hypothetical protein EJ06DRAFT_540343 [Trichodelitschia bisporula]|uniref:Response regulatory domain-containing protein n=1 Tax=Trichodelitschia bisporula TaxID=703511 RepID=A0A6G1HIB8_9PEZI|nr:hypothetical protein EJ06DRAFT_540343 [Trichodelitschia bisporula]
MAEFQHRLRTKLFRRFSTQADPTSAPTEPQQSPHRQQQHHHSLPSSTPPPLLIPSPSSAKHPKSSLATITTAPSTPPSAPPAPPAPPAPNPPTKHPLTTLASPPTPSPSATGFPSASLSPAVKFALQAPTPTPPVRPPSNPRKQSLVHPSDTRVINALLDESTLTKNMLHRKVWVRRAGGTSTQIQVLEDDLVDDAKDAILRKFANSLGRTYDAPDLLLRISPTANAPTERLLAPDEPLCQTLDHYFPAGQTLDDALTIDVPARRTPRASPRVHAVAAAPAPYYYNYDDTRPHESGTDYFPPMPMPAPGPPPAVSPGILTSTSHDSRHSHATHPYPHPHHPERAMSVLTTGQLPALPSPGSRRHRRPNHPRQHTSSPTAISNVQPQPQQPAMPRPTTRPRLDSVGSVDKPVQPLVPPALPTPPVPVPAVEPAPVTKVVPERPPAGGKRRRGKVGGTHSGGSGEGMLGALTISPLLDTSVPPINVLIVEDNMINMKLLEQFIRRLKVRWQTAVNGREAVEKWRKGGFHLVLMDIQLPIMSGLEATKEIRRLERVNRIGAFSTAPTPVQQVREGAGSDEAGDGDALEDVKRLFKSPVIIVALTASNLQSDRHEALAAGCNDFLTKPVNFVWFERKVKEWGCMQALIDFDGWRNWKDFAQQNGLKDASAGDGKAKDARESAAIIFLLSPHGHGQVKSARPDPARLPRRRAKSALRNP